MAKNRSVFPNKPFKTKCLKKNNPVDLDHQLGFSKFWSNFCAYYANCTLPSPVKPHKNTQRFSLGFYLINPGAPHAVLSSICKAVLVKLTFIFSESSPGSFGEETPPKPPNKQSHRSVVCLKKGIKKTNTN